MHTWRIYTFMTKLWNLRRTLCGSEKIEQVPKVWNEVDLVDLVLRYADGAVHLLPRCPRRE